MHAALSENWDLDPSAHMGGRQPPVVWTPEIKDLLLNYILGTLPRVHRPTNRQNMYN